MTWRPQGRSGGATPASRPSTAAAMTSPGSDRGRCRFSWPSRRKGRTDSRLPAPRARLRRRPVKPRHPPAGSNPSPTTCTRSRWSPRGATSRERPSTWTSWPRSSCCRRTHAPRSSCTTCSGLAPGRRPACPRRGTPSPPPAPPSADPALPSQPRPRLERRPSLRSQPASGPGQAGPAEDEAVVMMRFIFGCESADRDGLRALLTPGAVLQSVPDGAVYTGRDAVTDRLLGDEAAGSGPGEPGSGPGPGEPAARPRPRRRPAPARRAPPSAHPAPASGAFSLAAPTAAWLSASTGAPHTTSPSGRMLCTSSRSTDRPSPPSSASRRRRSSPTSTSCPSCARRASTRAREPDRAPP